MGEGYSGWAGLRISVDSVGFGRLGHFQHLSDRISPSFSVGACPRSDWCEEK